MRNIFALVLVSAFLTGCGILFPFPESKIVPTTSFHVKNNSTQAINFKASVIKRNSMGPFEMTNAFTVTAKDSVLVRQVSFKRESESPQNWFSKFTIFPIEGLEMNDPNTPGNWIQGVNQNGKPFYTFTIAE
jgi:hypothetical protein